MKRKSEVNLAKKEAERKRQNERFDKLMIEGREKRRAECVAKQYFKPEVFYHNSLNIHKARLRELSKRSKEVGIVRTKDTGAMESKYHGI